MASYTIHIPTSETSNALQPVQQFQHPTQVGNQQYIPDPNLAETHAIYASQNRPLVSKNQIDKEGNLVLTETTNADDVSTEAAAVPEKIRHHDTSTDEVTDEEHIAFQALWLSRWVFCSRSLQWQRALGRKRVIKEAAAQKDAEASRSNKASGDDSVNTGKKPMSSKPPPTPKRKPSNTSASDDEDRSPPHTRQAAKKRQKATISSVKGKGSGTSKPTSSSDKVLSDEQLLKTDGNALVVESHNLSPDNIPPKDDAGTITSDLKASTLNFDLDNPQGVPQQKSPSLSPVLKDNEPSAKATSPEHTEDTHSNDGSPVINQDEDMEDPPQHSNTATNEVSSLHKSSNVETSTFGTIVAPATTSTKTSSELTPAELEQLKNTDPVSFLKAMMNAKSVLPIMVETSLNILVESGTGNDTPNLLRQIKKKFFETNLIEVLSKDSTSCFGLNNLLKKVDLLQVSDEASQVIVSLSSLLDQLQADNLRKREVDQKLNTKVTSHSSSWKAANESTTKEEEIDHLQEKVKAAKSRQEEIKQLKKKELDDVVQAGIQHIETAQKLVPEIEELKKQQATIERHLSLWASQYSTMKNNLPADFA
ncbi:uncharacterized protein LOC131662626 [Vicia villosa]|uniref:uncharacterized protein LOC131662626 n=1 Tax=Vicia villosa TaxID=3911 RepID=UPI00273B4329|nr:uncharacterized protein LOC131662626 [Vicia villosa]